MKSRITSILFPSKSISTFIISFFIIGIISGSIFLICLSTGDKTIVNTELRGIISGNLTGNIKNTLTINLLYIISIFILGISTIGLVFNGFIVYLKGFVTGFCVSSMIYIYKVKGLLLGLIYLIPHNIINILIILSLSIYSIIFSLGIIKQITGKRINTINLLKRYTFIFLVSLGVIILTSIIEVYFTTFLLNSVSGLFK